MLLNWRDHSWLHLFRQDKVVCWNISVSGESGRREEEEDRTQRRDRKKTGEKRETNKERDRGERGVDR